MLRFLKRFLFILFFQSLLLLTVFYIDESYYTEWLITFIIAFFLLIFISLFVVPSRKKETMLKNWLEDYKRITTLEASIKLNALQLEFTCPACSKTNNFWGFLENYKCNSCNSDLWSTKLKDQPEEYTNVFTQKEQVNNFYDRIPYRTLKKIKKLALFQTK